MPLLHPLRPKEWKDEAQWHLRRTSLEEKPEDIHSEECRES